MTGQKAKRSNRTKAKRSSLPDADRPFYEETGLTPTERDLESDEAMWNLYHMYCRNHNIRRTHKEMKRNFSNFKKNAFRVFEMNQKIPSSHFIMYIGCDKTHERVPQDQSGDSSDEDIRIIPVEKDLESDEAVWDLYKRWCLHHKLHRTHGEMEQRFNVFKNNATDILGYNQEDESSSGGYCMYEWCDITDEETVDGGCWA